MAPRKIEGKEGRFFVNGKELFMGDVTISLEGPDEEPRVIGIDGIFLSDDGYDLRKVPDDEEVIRLDEAVSFDGLQDGLADNADAIQGAIDRALQSGADTFKKMASGPVSDKKPAWMDANFDPNTGKSRSWDPSDDLDKDAAGPAWTIAADPKLKSKGQYITGVDLGKVIGSGGMIGGYGGTITGTINGGSLSKSGMVSSTGIDGKKSVSDMFEGILNAPMPIMNPKKKSSHIPLIDMTELERFLQENNVSIRDIYMLSGLDEWKDVKEITVLGKTLDVRYSEHVYGNEFRLHDRWSR